jgi:hypothetical protein
VSDSERLVSIAPGAKHPDFGEAAEAEIQVVAGAIGTPIASTRAFTVGGTNGSYVALHGPIADMDERGDARERDTDVTPTYVVWMRVTSDKLFPFDGMIFPHSFRGLLKLAVEQRAAEMSTKST